MAQPFSPPCDKLKITAQPCPREEGRLLPAGRRRLVLAACILASSMAFIDGAALTVALPALRADFDTGLTTIQWVINGYVLALAALTMVGGSLADIYGKGRILIIGCVLFAIASVACALAPTAAWLIVARIGQGVAAALVTPASLALIGAVYPRNLRNQAIGIWAAASALTSAGGPILGGWLTESFGWQAIFWINPPLALVAIFILLRAAPGEGFLRRPFDMPGAALLAAALAALAAALSFIGPGEGGHAAQGETPMPLLSIAGFSILALVGLAGFLLRQRQSAYPMMPPKLFANPTFSGLNIATLLLYMGLSVIFFVLPFELIEQRGLSATAVGLVFLPFTLSVGLLSRVFAGLSGTLGVRLPLVTGALLAAVGCVIFILLAEAPLWASVLLPMLVLGVGFALVVAPLTAEVMSAVPQADEGLASGINNTASRIAQLIGVALAAALAGFAQGFGLAMSMGALVSVLAAFVFVLTVQGRARDRV